TDGTGAGRSFGRGENRFCDAALGRVRDRGDRGSPEIEFERDEEHCLSRGPEIAACSAALCGNKSAGTRHGNGIMKHMTEEELIAYREGVAEQGALISKHLAACEECRTELERIEAVLAALDTLPVPDPGDDYGRHMWQQIAPRLPERPARWWQAWFEPKRLGALASVAALLVMACLTGRITKQGPTG